MKIKTITTLFSVVLAGLFISLAALLVKVSSLLESEAQELAMAAESISIAERLQSRLLIHNRGSFLYSLHRDPEQWTSRNALRTEIVGLLNSMRILVNNEEEGQLLSRVETEIKSYLEKRDRLVASRLSAVDEYSEVSKDVDTVLGVVDELISFNQLQMQSLTESISAQNRMADQAGVALLSLGALLLLGLIYMMTFSIARPVKTLNEIISRFSSGENSLRAKAGGLHEIQRIASNFNSMADTLEEKQKEQLRFVASIAHDLRNPLNSMSMASELLSEKGNQEDRELAAIISRQVKNLDRMVGDLLDTTRIEAGQIELRPSELDLAALIRDSVQLHAAGTQIHKFNIDLPGESLNCRVDESRISRVINNLISNAIKYSPDGGTITIRAVIRGDDIVLSVADQGIGIAPADFENIFKPFHRTKATKGTIPGIGLGLSASRRIVEAHGGKVTVESKAGAGSVFSVSLRRQKAYLGLQSALNV